MTRPRCHRASSLPLRGLLLLVLLAAGGCRAQEPAGGGATKPGPGAAAAGARAAVQLGGRSVEVVVEDAGGGPDDVRRLLETTVLGLPRVEEAAGFAYPRPWPVRVRVYADMSETGNEVGYYDHRDGTIHVWRGIPDWLMVHELAHAWFLEGFAADFRGAERWLIEGLAHFTAELVCRREPVLGDPVHIRHVLVEETMKAGPPGFDPPLASWNPPFPIPAGAGEELLKQKLGWYGKAYGFFHLARALGGADLVQRANARVAERGAPVDTRTYLAILAELAPGLGAAAPGWVLDGARDPAWGRELLDDPDGDGITSGEEQLTRTRPDRPDTDRDGAGDGEELFVLGTDPRDALSRPARPPLRADGDLADWPGDAVVRGDPAGDATAPADLVEARALVDGYYLCLALRTTGGFPARGTAWNVGIDADGDEDFDLIVGFGEGLAPWIGRVAGDFARTAWRPNRAAPHLTKGDTAELFLPLAALGLTGKVRLFPYTTGGPEQARLDALGAWIEVELPGE